MAIDTSARWEYLITPAYQVRQAIAAYYVRRCPVVVDVGAYRVALPVSGELHTIDPLCTIPGAYHGGVGAWWAEHSALRGFGLALLGIDILGGAGEVRAVDEMIDAAAVTVIEWSRTHPSSLRQIDQFLRNRRPAVTMMLSLPNIGTAGFPVHGERQLVVIGDA